MELTTLRESIPALHDRVYLNTGTSGPSPQEAAEEQFALLRLLLQEGFAAPPAIKAYLTALDRARKAVAAAIGAPPHTVALQHSTSEGIGVIAAGLQWSAGDEVIISDLEHTSGVAPWLHLARTRGVKIVNLKSEDGYIPPDAFARAITGRTRLICLSHVSYATGALLPVADVCRLAEERGVWVVVDGAQGAGHIPMDVTALECHAYALPGQKWLLGPEGTGGLYVREDVIDQIDPTRIGWASLRHEDVSALTYTLQDDARRFETGTLHAPAFAALAKSIEILSALGWERIFARATELAAAARSSLQEVTGVRVLTPSHAATGLLTFAADTADLDGLVSRLWSQHRVIVRSIPAPRALRASFHAFNNEEDVEALVRALERELQRGGAGS